jgi:hypothetical protein
VIDRSGRGGAVCLRRGVDKLQTERSLGTAQVHVPTRPWRPRRRREHDPSSPHVHSRRDSMRSPETRRPESPVKDVDHAFPVSRPPGAAASSDQAPLPSQAVRGAARECPATQPRSSRFAAFLSGRGSALRTPESDVAPRRTRARSRRGVRSRRPGCAVDLRGAKFTAGCAVTAAGPARSGRGLMSGQPSSARAPTPPPPRRPSRVLAEGPPSARSQHPLRSGPETR